MTTTCPKCHSPRIGRLRIDSDQGRGGAWSAENPEEEDLESFPGIDCCVCIACGTCFAPTSPGLLPCPFCGSTASVHDGTTAWDVGLPRTQPLTYYAACDNTECHTVDRLFVSAEEAAAAWNTRTVS